MLNFFRVPVYIKIFRDKAEITNLKTGQVVCRSAIEKFSTNRIVVADFNRAEIFIRSVLDELFSSKRLFKPAYKMLIQQMELPDDRLNEIEKRALRDLGEQAGATFVALVDHTKGLSTEEALAELKKY